MKLSGSLLGSVGRLGQDGAFRWLLSPVTEEPCRGRAARSHFRHILTVCAFYAPLSACRAHPLLVSMTVVIVFS
jgi:hypothetical protein